MEFSNYETENLCYYVDFSGPLLEMFPDLVEMPVSGSFARGDGPWVVWTEGYANFVYYKDASKFSNTLLVRAPTDMLRLNDIDMELWADAVRLDKFRFYYEEYDFEVFEFHNLEEFLLTFELISACTLFITAGNHKDVIKKSRLIDDSPFLRNHVSNLTTRTTSKGILYTFIYESLPYTLRLGWDSQVIWFDLKSDFDLVNDMDSTLHAKATFSR